jgi:hypothetical protein
LCGGIKRTGKMKVVAYFKVLSPDGLSRAEYHWSRFEICNFRIQTEN